MDNDLRAAMVESVAIVIVCKLVDVAEPDTRISQLTNEELKEVATAALDLALEEAASLCVKQAEMLHRDHDDHSAAVCLELAAAIRALKSNPGNAS